MKPVDFERGTSYLPYTAILTKGYIDIDADRTKRPLILWTGGVDSTALLVLCLAKGIIPDVAYFSTVQGADKAEQELDARKKIVKILSEAGYDTAPMRDYVVTTPLTSTVITVNGAWDRDSYYFNQGSEWAMQAARVVNWERHSEIMYGMVSGDSWVSVSDTVAEICHRVQYTRSPRIVPMTFPLINNTKPTIVKYLRQRLNELDEAHNNGHYGCTWDQLKQVLWSCELPTSDGPCGECPACKRRDAELDKYGLSTEASRNYWKNDGPSVSTMVKANTDDSEIIEPN